jgi:hypothetical protein
MADDSRHDRDRFGGLSGRSLTPQIENSLVVCPATRRNRAVFAIEKHPDLAHLGFVIDTEVPMLKTHRRSLHFDSLEGKVLLSVGMADPAATVQRSAAKPFVLNGSVQGLPAGKFGPKGLVVSSFAVSGHFGSMGKVTGFFLLSDKVVTPGTMPDLANSLLVLTNSEGSLLLGIKPAKHHYSFQIIGVTSHYISVSGSGTLTVSPSPTAANLVITLHSAKT